MEKPRKGEIVSFNKQEIRKALDKIIEQIKISDIDQPTVLERVLHSDLILLDESGMNFDCQLQYRFNYRTGTQLYDVSIDISKISNHNTIATREYYFLNDYAPQVINGEKIVTCLSSLNVYQLKAVGIGSTLLSKGEDIKAITGRKVAKRFGIQKMKSRIRDDSDPPLWTTDSALALGYTPIGVTGGYETFEKIDDLSSKFSPENVDLAGHWQKDYKLISKLKRYLIRRLSR